MRYKLELTKYLVEHRLDLNIFDLSQGKPLLHSAILNPHCEQLALFMVSHGADIHTKNLAGRNALDVCRMYRSDCPSLVAKIETSWNLYKENNNM